jgi:hypothetical protein
VEVIDLEHAYSGIRARRLAGDGSVRRTRRAVRASGPSFRRARRGGTFGIGQHVGGGKADHLDAHFAQAAITPALDLSGFAPSSSATTSLSGWQAKSTMPIQSPHSA